MVTCADVSITVQQNFLLDTNIINWLVDGDIDLNDLISNDLYITGVQKDELKQTGRSGNEKDIRRTDKLLEMVNVIEAVDCFSHGFAYDIPGAGYGEATWDDKSDLTQQMLTRLKELDKVKGKEKRKADMTDAEYKKKLEELHKNQNRDIILARTAQRDDLTLVTADRNLALVMEAFGGKVKFYTK